MATEADDVKNRGVYVDRVSRGFKRWFFSVSVPHDYLDWLANDESRVIREPELVGREIATVLDNLLQAARPAARQP